MIRDAFRRLLAGRPRSVRRLLLVPCLLPACALAAFGQGPGARPQTTPIASAASTGVPFTVPAPSLAGYRVLAVSYLLRGPDGALLRVTRYPAGAEPGAWSDGALVPPGGVQPAQWLSGWTGGWLWEWLFQRPHFYSGIGETIRDTWAMLLRVLDYLGVLVLLAGTWVIWFLVRPGLIGLSDRQAFALVFVLVGGLWLYATGLTMSVVYALGLMVLPALVLGLLSWGLRHAWRAWVAGGGGDAET